MRPLIVRHHADPPPCQPGEQVVAASARYDGALVVVATAEPDRANMVQGLRSPAWREEWNAALYVYLPSAEYWLRTEIPNLTISFPLATLTADDELVLVGSRSPGFPGGPPENGHAFALDGAHRASWRIGDGIEHIVPDAVGTVWVGYFDEGIHGDDSLAWPGLVRWSARGDRLWAYQPPPGVGAINDCYALNGAGHDVWTCYHREFPVVRLSEGQATAYANEVAGAVAFAVVPDASEIVFLGGYASDRENVVWCRLAGGQVQATGSGALVDPEGDPVRWSRFGADDKAGWQLVAAAGSRIYFRHRSGHYHVADAARD